MLNPFPSLLIFGFFAPTILRVAVALLSFYVAYVTWRAEAGKATSPVGWASIVANIVIGGMLLVGYYTQWAALIALLMRLASFVLPRTYQHFVVLPTSTRLLAIALLISLLFTGAGALAFDLPL